jgi:hypothetical protein
VPSEPWRKAPTFISIAQFLALTQFSSPVSLPITSSLFPQKITQQTPFCVENYGPQICASHVRSACLMSLSLSSIMKIRWHDPFSVVSTAEENKEGARSHPPALPRLVCQIPVSAPVQRHAIIHHRSSEKGERR